MPHLSPMSWPLMLISFWLILLLLLTHLWWLQLPSFPKLPFPQTSSAKSSWQWK